MKNGAQGAGERMGGAQTLPMAYEFAGFRLEPARRALTGADGEPVRLGGKAFDTLIYLVERAGELVDRDELLRGVWPKRVIEDNNLNQAVATLRRVLGEGHVATVAGRGYQFVTPVRRVKLAAAEPPMGPAPHSGLRANGAPAAMREALRARRNFRPAALVAALAAVLTAAAALIMLTPPRSPGESLVAANVTVQPLTAFPGEELTPAFSPDGARVAFSWQDSAGSRAIYVTQVGVAQPMRLSDPGTAQDLHPAWSPDGERIAFMRHHNPERFDVMVIPGAGGGARRLYSGSTRWISVDGSPVLSWTPNLELLFASKRHGPADEQRFGLHRLNPETGMVEDLGLDNEASHFDTSPAVSPDGRWLAFTRYTLSQRLNQVMLQRLGPDLAPIGSPQPIEGLDPDIHHSLHWSANADRLWFASSNRIIEWPIGGSPRAIHTLGPRFASGAMSIVPRATGARAAVVVRRADEDLFALPVDPVTHTAVGLARVRAPSSGVELHPRVSPDGKSLAFVSDRTGPREIWLADVDGSRARQLTSVGQLIVGYPRWSPDGKTIAFHSSAPEEPRVIYRVDVESGVTSRLFNGCCPGGWTADGRSLYVTETGDINYVARIDVATGARERLIEGETAMESADGQYLLYSRSREEGYFRWPLQTASGGGKAMKLVDDYKPSQGGIAPVADGFYYVGLTGDFIEPRAIRFYDYALGEAKDVAPVPARTRIGLTVTPDGREILYSAVDAPETDILLLEFESADE